jgi:hypothetical protein
MWRHVSNVPPHVVRPSKRRAFYTIYTQRADFPDRGNSAAYNGR